MSNHEPQDSLPTNLTDLLGCFYFFLFWICSGLRSLFVKNQQQIRGMYSPVHALRNLRVLHRWHDVHRQVAPAVSLHARLLTAKRNLVRVQARRGLALRDGAVPVRVRHAVDEVLNLVVRQRCKAVVRLAGAVKRHSIRSLRRDHLVHDHRVARNAVVSLSRATLVRVQKEIELAIVRRRILADIDDDAGDDVARPEVGNVLAIGEEANAALLRDDHREAWPPRLKLLRRDEVAHSLADALHLVLNHVAELLASHAITHHHDPAWQKVFHAKLRRLLRLERVVLVGVDRSIVAFLLHRDRLHGS
mmetsp:Transcript_1434/g.3178  ORF Transcript_1434/g.3178 Transcript_1434/m.3178 type:complete len:304 (-) Transcript_1434:2619-3530(-)